MESIEGIKIVAASGKQGCGKSTLAASLRTKAVGIYDFVSVMKFADPIYELHEAIRNKTIRFITDGVFDIETILNFAKDDLTYFVLNKMETWTGFRPAQESQAVTDLIDYLVTWVTDRTVSGSVADKEGPLLQYLGTEFGRSVYGENVWAEILIRRIEKREFGGWTADSKLVPEDEQTGDGLIFVDDCRFENEFNSLTSALRVRLECSEATRMGRASSWRPNTNHPSEIGLDAYALDGKFSKTYNTDTDGIPADDIAQDIIDTLQAAE